MPARQTDRLLRLFAATAALAAALVVAASLAMPMPKATGTAAAIRRPTSTSRPAMIDAMPSAQAVAFVADFPLRRPLNDSKKAFVVATTRPAMLGLTLRGTIVEPGRSFAVFATSTGKVQVCEAGERVDDAEILVITAATVTIRLGDRSIVLDVPRPPTSGAFGT